MSIAEPPIFIELLKVSVEPLQESIELTKELIEVLEESFRLTTTSIETLEKCSQHKKS